VRHFIVFVHVVVGVVIVYLELNTQAVTFRKLHRTDSYYSSEDLRNSAIIGHVESLKRTERQLLAEGVFRLALGVFSIVGAIAFARRRRWAAFCLPLVTLLMTTMVVRASASAGGFEAAAYALPVFALFAFFGVEALYIYTILRARSGTP